MNKEIEQVAARFVELLKEEVKDGNTKKAMAINTKLTKELFSYMGSLSTSDKISLPFAITAFEYQIETEGSPQDAILWACLVHNKDYDQLLLDNTHNKRWWLGERLVKSVPWFDKESDNILLSKVAVKKDVKSSTTFRKGLGDMGKYQKLDKEIRSMKERLDKLEIDSVMKDGRLDSLEDVVGTKSLKEKARVFKAKGYTYKEIGSIMEVTDRTVKRWLKD